LRSVRVLMNIVTDPLRFSAAGLTDIVIARAPGHAPGHGDDSPGGAAFPFTGGSGPCGQAFRPPQRGRAPRDPASRSGIGGSACG